MIRGDDLATLYFFHPLAKRTLPRRRSISILMYHSISDRQENGRHPYFQTVTTPAVFTGQMKYLAENGYQSISLSEALTRLNTGAVDNRKTFVLTFDDGFRDFYTAAFPVIAKYGFTASMFLPSSYIGKSTRLFNGVECMNWSEVRELSRSGIEFGAHTVSHPQLSLLKDTDIRYEVSHSKREIEEQLQLPVTSFAYPYAFPESKPLFCARLRQLLEGAGYQCGVSTMIGNADGSGDRFFLRRLPINSFDGGKLLQAKLDGGYDWMHTIQYVVKQVKFH